MSVQPRILFVCPEVIAVPNRSEHMTRYTVAQRDGFTDPLADLIADMNGLGVDMQVFQPNFGQSLRNCLRGNCCCSISGIICYQYFPHQNRSLRFNTRLQWRGNRLHLKADVSRVLIKSSAVIVTQSGS